MASLWIIDGYNFIRVSRKFSELEGNAPTTGRQAALRWLGEFSQLTGEALCVILDAYGGVHREQRNISAFGIEILESRGGYTADEEILARAKNLGQGAIVVSSDREVLVGAIRAGCSVLSSQEFEREVEIIFRHARENQALDRGSSPLSPRRGDRPPKEKKKAFQILRKYQ